MQDNLSEMFTTFFWRAISTFDNVGLITNIIFCMRYYGLPETETASETSILLFSYFRAAY